MAARVDDLDEFALPSTGNFGHLGPVRRFTVEASSDGFRRASAERVTN